MASQADAAMFAELKARVDALEEKVVKLEARVGKVRDYVRGKDVSEETLGPKADPEERKRIRAELDAAFGPRRRGEIGPALSAPEPTAA